MAWDLWPRASSSARSWPSIMNVPVLPPRRPLPGHLVQHIHGRILSPEGSAQQDEDNDESLLW